MSPLLLSYFVGSVLSAASLPKELKRKIVVVMIAARLTQQRAEAQQAPIARKWKFQTPPTRSRIFTAIMIIVTPLS